MKIDPNAPAYPFDPEASGTSCRGMTIRAAMATQIMAGMIASAPIADRTKIDKPKWAGIACEWTDALIAALNA
jgi:hypothetical protein